MAYAELGLFIDGAWRREGSGGSLPVIDPATEETLGALPLAGAAELDAALTAAEKGFAAWRATTAEARQRVMEKAARALEADHEAIAVTLTREMGKPLAEARMELDFAIAVLRWYGEEGKRAYGRLVPSRAPGVRLAVVKEPVGPVAAFVAWNFPAVNVMRKVAGALGAGCSIVIKPSEETPATAIAIARAFEAAGLPAGVLNVVFGEPDAVSRHVLASPVCRKLSFTGSVPIGKHLQKLAAETLKRCTMELGGHAPVLVFEDADVEAAAKAAAAAKFRNAGQVCISPTRFYVQERACGAFAEAFVAAAQAVKVGNGLEPGVAMGPLVGERRLEVMQGFVDDAVKHGAKRACGGERLGNRGWFYAPTVLTDVPETARIMNEEPFGPVAPIASFADEGEAVAKANRLPFGLAAYAFTRDGARAARLADAIDSGLVGVNSFTVSLPETPFGGVNDSGYGSEGGIEGLEAFLRVKLVSETGV